ncbi:MAG: metallophosphoesterase [Anaerolineae bacterium]
MKILTVSDVVADSLHSSGITERFKDVDLVLSCGDLPIDYLEYIVTMLGKPLYYVHGNHVERKYTDFGATPRADPEGCINLHRRTANLNGLLIAGLQGSMRYREGDYQYTQQEMQWLVNLMVPKLLLNKLRYGRFLDILITHAPPYQIHDGLDLCHQGFDAFLRFMQMFKPRYLIHGHTHLYRQDARRVTRYRQTLVLNTYGYQIIEIDDSLLTARS